MGYSHTWHSPILPTPGKIEVKCKLLNLVNGSQERQELNIKERKQRGGGERLMEEEEKGVITQIKRAFEWPKGTVKTWKIFREDEN